MKSLVKTQMSMFLVLLTAAVSLAGCGGGQASKSGQVGESVAKTWEKPKEPVTISFYLPYAGDTATFMEQYGNSIAKKFPHVTLKVINSPDTNVAGNLSNLLASQEPIDIFLNGDTNHYRYITPFKFEYDMTDMIKRSGYDLNRLEPSTLEAVKALSPKGEMYALPLRMNVMSLLYNKDIFDKFAVPYPTDGMTWDEAYELAKRVTRKDGDTQYYGFANDNNSYLQVNQYSLDLVDPKTFKASFETDAWKKIVQTLTRFMMIPGVDVSQATVANFNTKGIVAMATNYTGCCGFTPGDGVKNWGVIKIPDFPDIRGVGPQTFPNYWYMSSTSKHREAAFEVMKFIISDEFQASLNARGLATALNNPKMYLEYGKDFPKYNGQNVAALFPKHAKMSNITEFQIVAATNLNAALTNIATKGVDINTALREAAEATNKKIEETKGAAKK